MTKVLNLDDFEQSVDKSVTLNGKSHEFKPFTVDEFISQLKEIEGLEKDGQLSIAQYVEFSIGTIKRAFPTIEESELRALTITKLKALTDFVRDVAENEAQAGGEQAAGNGEGAAS